MHATTRRSTRDQHDERTERADDEHQRPERAEHRRPRRVVGTRQVESGGDAGRRSGTGGVDRQVEPELGGLAVERDLRQPRMLGHPFHAAVGPKVGQERLGRGLAVVERHAVEAVRRGQHRGLQVVEEVHVGLDDFGPTLAEGQDAQRHPGVLGRDRDVDRRAVADVLATFRGRFAIEGGSQEDLAAGRVELEHLGRVRREAEAVVLGPARRPRRRRRAGP